MQAGTTCTIVTLSPAASTAFGFARNHIWCARGVWYGTPIFPSSCGALAFGGPVDSLEIDKCHEGSTPTLPPHFRAFKPAGEGWLQHIRLPTGVHLDVPSYRKPVLAQHMLRPTCDSDSMDAVAPPMRLHLSLIKRTPSYSQPHSRLDAPMWLSVCPCDDGEAHHDLICWRPTTPGPQQALQR